MKLFELSNEQEAALKMFFVGVSEPPKFLPIQIYNFSTQSNHIVIPHRTMDMLY